MGLIRSNDGPGRTHLEAGRWLLSRSDTSHYVPNGYVFFLQLRKPQNRSHANEMNDLRHQTLCRRDVPAAPFAPLAQVRPRNKRQSSEAEVAAGPHQYKRLPAPEGKMVSAVCGGARKMLRGKRVPSSKGESVDILVSTAAEYPTAGTPVQVAGVEGVEEGRGGVLLLLTRLSFAAVPGDGLGG